MTTDALVEKVARAIGLMRGAVCCGIVQHMPFASRQPFFALQLALLPYAGDWAYRDCGGRYDFSEKEK